MKKHIQITFASLALLFSGMGGHAFAQTAQPQNGKSNKAGSSRKSTPVNPGAERPDISAEVAPVPHVPNVVAPSVDAMDEQIEKGVKFLLQTQNADGSWGDHGMTKGLNVLCPVPGGAMAFQAAVTSLDVLGLSNCAPEDAQVQVALDKAETWLLANLGKLRRPDTSTILNFWGHAYGVRALCALSQRVSNASQAYAKLKAECQNQVDKLMMYSDGGGGWGYYEFKDTSTRPNGNPTSFCTATGLLALKDAELTFGIKGDKKVINKAIKFLYNQRTPSGSYLYSYGHYLAPQRDINAHTGSLARTPACNAALYAYGHKKITRQIVEDGLDWLWARGGWLDMARMKPVPHESFAKNAGYFFYYAYFYAAEDIKVLDAEKQKRHSSYLTRTLLPLQQKDGSWWDYPLYNYHKAYGTGYSLYSLAHAREVLYGAKFKTQ